MKEEKIHKRSSRLDWTEVSANICICSYVRAHVICKDGRCSGECEIWNQYCVWDYILPKQIFQLKELFQYPKENFFLKNLDSDSVAQLSHSEFRFR